VPAIAVSQRRLGAVVETISKFRTIVNFKVVAALGLGNTPTLLPSVDEVTE
jgi:hypothetical protein